MCRISASKFMHAYFNWFDWLTRNLVILRLIQDGGKISPCGDFRNKRNNYSLQVFKTMQDVHGWIGPFDIAFAAYTVGFLLRQVLCII